MNALTEHYLLELFKEARPPHIYKRDHQTNDYLVPIRLVIKFLAEQAAREDLRRGIGSLLDEMQMSENDGTWRKLDPMNDIEWVCDRVGVPTFSFRFVSIEETPPTDKELKALGVALECLK